LAAGSRGVEAWTVCFAAVEFELSADQTALESAAADLLDGLASSQRVRAFVGPGTTDTSEGQTGPGAGGFDRPLWEAMADQGWLGVERPEAAGGLGLGMVEVSVLCEQVGRRVAPAPFLGSILAMVALQEAGLDEPLPPAGREEAARWAARLSTGEAVGCVVWAAQPGTLTVRPEGERWLLDGRPEPTLYASVADVAVVVTEDAVYAVELDEAGRPPPQPAMDRTRPLAWLGLAGTPAQRIGGQSAASRLVDRAAAGSAAELLGASARVLEMTVEYAKVRRQFGHPIGSFQAIKHRLADALVDVEAMRSCTYYAAWCVATRDPEASLAASMAKAWCSDASQRVMASGMQVHGGIGFTWDHDLHLFLKRARQDATGFGTAVWHRDRIAGMLERRLAEGVSPL
jgi:alkylation response protein AidB-like acyl-CoA dehydrogenase